MGDLVSHLYTYIYIYIHIYIHIHIYSIPAGSFTQLWKTTMFNGKIHYDPGHVHPFPIVMSTYQSISGFFTSVGDGVQIIYVYIYIYVLHKWLVHPFTQALKIRCFHDSTGSPCSVLDLIAPDFLAIAVPLDLVEIGISGHPSWRNRDIITELKVIHSDSQ